MGAIRVWRAGNQISSASASVDCQAHIFAQTYAFAAAKSSVAARCYGKSSNAKARTSIEAAVDALVYDDSKCVVKTKKKGLSRNKTKHIARTRSVRPPCRLYKHVGAKRHAVVCVGVISSEQQP